MSQRAGSEWLRRLGIWGTGLAVVVGLAWSPVWSADPGKGPLAAGRALETAGKNDEALAWYRRQLAQQPTIDAHLAVISLLGKIGRHADGIAAAASALHAFPGDRNVLNAKGLLHFRKGDENAARTCWQQVLAKDPRNSFATTWLAKLGKNAGKGGGTGSAAASSAAGGSGVATGSGHAGRVDSGAEVVATADSGNPAATLGDAAWEPGKGKTAGNVDEQKKLAERLYATMAGTGDHEFKTFIDLHQQVIDQCPDTERAPESCWRLANLWQFGTRAPNYDRAIPLIEHLLRRYPHDPIVGTAINRLCMLYAAAGRKDKLAEFYAGLFAGNPDMPAETFLCKGIDYARTLEELGRKAEAKDWYEKVVAKDGTRNTPEGRLARQRAAQL